MTYHYVEETKHRSALRLALGKTYYSLKRYAQWHKFTPFASEFLAEPMEYEYFSHRTPLLRQLRDVDMELQFNKVHNLNIAVPRLSGLVLHPGETLSYWKAIGRTSARRGYKPGMVLTGGKVSAEVGGGLCQLSNLIYWMTLHTPLTVIERHHHGYDVFPDSNRTQPFGSGATCYYPYVDLMIRNDTLQDFQLFLHVGTEYLEGAWLTDQLPRYRYQVVERGHEIRAEYWGGYSRHNELWRKIYAADGSQRANDGSRRAEGRSQQPENGSQRADDGSRRANDVESCRTMSNDTLLGQEYITENHVLMMYQPFLETWK